MGTTAERDLPQVFIGSSTEGLEIAQEIADQLGGEASIRFWPKEDVFRLGDMTLPRLIDVATQVDFAILVLTADDVVNRRGTQREAPRDNTIFEAGLFIGELGHERTFLVHTHELRVALPTDLAGLTTAGYSDSGDIPASVGSALRSVREGMRRLGRRGFVPLELRVRVPTVINMGDLRVAVAGTLNRLSERWPLWEPGEEMRPAGRDEWMIQLSGPEGTGIEYKYMLGPPWNWSRAEEWEDGSFRENRRLVLDQRKSHRTDVVEAWRRI